MLQIQQCFHEKSWTSVIRLKDISVLMISEPTQIWGWKPVECYFLPQSVPVENIKQGILLELGIIARLQKRNDV